MESFSTPISIHFGILALFFIIVVGGSFFPRLPFLLPFVKTKRRFRGFFVIYLILLIPVFMNWHPVLFSCLSLFLIFSLFSIASTYFHFQRIGPARVSLYHATPSPSTLFHREIKDGKAVETRSRAVFYITEEHWKNNQAVTPEVKGWFTKEFRIAPNLYSCPTENMVMQVVDSLSLYRYLISTENEEFVETLRTLLLNPQTGQSVPTASIPTSLTAAPVSVPTTTSARKQNPALAPTVTSVPVSLPKSISPLLVSTPPVSAPQIDSTPTPQSETPSGNFSLESNPVADKAQGSSEPKRKASTNRRVRKPLDAAEPGNQVKVAPFTPPAE